jgi:hypothetical protein
MVHIKGETFGGPWKWDSPEKRQTRNEHIRELYRMGKTRQELSEMFDLTKVRIMQIVRTNERG